MDECVFYLFESFAHTLNVIVSHARENAELFIVS